ncbi:MAG: tol-pal system protein YbgF [Desulfonauticus sp.]|nr:tol-pal system protein YbgF [Desulfonauticus sp.]
MYLWGESGLKNVNWYKLVGVILLLALSAACVTKEDLSSLRYEMYSQQSRLEQENKALKQEIARLQKELKETEKSFALQLQKESSPVRSTQANLWAEMQNLRIKIASLNGQVDRLDREQQKFSKFSQNATVAIDNLQKKVGQLEGMLLALSNRLGVELEQTGQTQNATSSKNSSSPALGQASTPEEQYKQALDAFYARKYDLAQTLWESFVKLYPKHKLVPNAYFWQGECFYQMGDYKRAILAYQEVIDKYPKSSKLPSALLKQAMAFAKIQKNKAAILLLKDVIKRFPKTIEAKRAKAFLIKLEGKR